MPAARLADIVLGHARSAPGYEAVVHDHVRLSYGALARHVLDARDALLAANFSPGGVIAFFGSPGPAFLVSELATHLAGGVWLGLNPRYTARELAHILGDARPRLVVADAGEATEALETALAGLSDAPPLMVLDRLEDLSGRLPHLTPAQRALPAGIALVVYTSGTTGVPKGAMLTHAGMLEAAGLYVQRYGQSRLRTLLNLPVNHVGALIDLAAPALLTGGTLVMMKSFDPAAIPAVLRRERVNLLGQVPAMHLAIDQAGGYDPASLPDLRHLVWSGAPMPRSWIEDRMGGPQELSTCYGLTECTGSVTFTATGAGVDELAGTVGRPAREGLVRVRAEAAGEPGEVEISGPLLMAGYLGQAEATRAAIDPQGWLKTGDLGVFDDNGSLRLAGRSREMFKSGGFNVYPREVETVLETFPGIAAAAVIAVPDDQWGEIGWAYILAGAPVDTRALERHARAGLANYKVPKRLIVREHLPLLPIGKIDKQALKREAERTRHG